MKFLVDVCVGKSVADWLVSEGYDVLEVRKINPFLSDEEILQLAVKESRILITMDKDFSELSVIYSRKHAGIVRLENLPIKERIAHLKRIIQHYKDILKKKGIIIQKGSKIRIIFQK